MRNHVFALAAIVALGLSEGVAGQQPNSPAASLGINGSFFGPPYPIQVGGVHGNVVTVSISGSGVPGLPIVVASGPIAPGNVLLGAAGSLDLDLSSPRFQLLLNGLDPGFPSAASSVLNNSSMFSSSFGYTASSASFSGLQALVPDPTLALGFRLTSAADFTPATSGPLHVSWTGSAFPLWQNNAGAVTTLPNCGVGPYLNGPLRITFGGQVDPNSLPSSGSALGSITITTPGPFPGTSLPAVGTFTVEDDPRLAPGNGRIVVFIPAPPTSTSLSGSCQGGLIADATYTLFVPDASQQQNVVRIAGTPNSVSLTTCFTTLPCNPAVPTGSYLDPSPGAPQVVATTPAMGVPAPPPVPVSSITNGVVSVSFSEPLLPGLIGPSTVRLVYEPTNASVPGIVSFEQASAPGSSSRISFTSSVALASGGTYRFEVNAAVTDLVGNPVQLVSGVPGGFLRFATQAQAPVPAPPIVEGFQNTLGVASIGALMNWGGGSVSIQSAEAIVGNGSYGPLVYPAGFHSLDTGMPAVPGFSNGVLDASIVVVPAGVGVRVFGPNRLHLRCTSTVTIAGSLNASAGMMAGAAPPETGAAPGGFNNGQGLTSGVVEGGLGGPGAGRGGRASQNGLLRTLRGDTGEGPTINGAPNTGSPPNILFGGGQGGSGGFRFPAGGVMGELGGLGGAGGSAFRVGENGVPFTGLPTCVPTLPTVQTIAFAAPTPIALIPPISQSSAGSGGGGGGDRFDTPVPANDDQGGGGGGGGGGVRISSLGMLSIPANGFIFCNGAAGGQGNVFFGGQGGGGSGGEIWLQSFTHVDISAAANLQVQGGPSGQLCSSHTSGAGGSGLIQLEDSDGVVNTSFVGGSGNNIVVTPIGVSGPNVASVATSTWRDTGALSPTYTSAAEVSNAGIGNIAITYQGAHGSAFNPAVPNLSTTSPPVSAAQIGTLSGYRFIRFTVTLSYATPMTFPIIGVLPSVSNIQINTSI